uniref:indole-3-pyruvate monooxygenase n=1 Tax=Leersia perrieri TaxID=77586 RepID=A0A0D9UZK1_9ORYZ
MSAPEAEHEEDVIIVGAGPSGLAAAACLSCRGVSGCLVLDRDDRVASLWRRRTYDRLHLHLHKRHCALPHAPHSDSSPTYLPRDDFLRYLDAYASRFAVRTRLRRHVRSARYDASRRRWIVEAVDLATGITESYTSRWLVAAGGENDERVVPDVAGMGTFPGKVVHAADYRTAEGFKGKSVLVVGSGNSGMEIAYDLAVAGAVTSIVVRSELHLVSKEIWNVAMTLYGYHLPPWVIDKAVLLMCRIVFGDTARHGLRRPAVGPFTMKLTTPAYPVFDVGIFAKIRSGEVRVLRAGIKSVRGSDVEFLDGERHAFDAVVFATGYRSTTKQWLQSDDGLIGEDGMAARSYPEHWKGENGLYCAGMVRRGLYGSYEDAELIADDISKQLQSSKSGQNGHISNGSLCSLPEATSMAVKTDELKPEHQHEEDVIIVGAGQSGLAASACLSRRGVSSCLILERDDCVAPLWRHRTYDRLRLHLPKRHCALPHAPHADDSPNYLPRDDFLRYLDAYASRFSLRTRLRRHVTSARYDPSCRRWLVHAVHLSTGITERYVSRCLVAANGENDERAVPDVPGMDTFPGIAIHAAEYKSAAAFKGKSVLVVGAGNSGMEIAYDLAAGGAAATSIVVRGELHLVSKEIWGVGMALARYIPEWAVDRAVLLMCAAVFGDTARHGLRRPAVGPFTMKMTTPAYPVFDVGTFAKIRSGEIRVVRAGIRSVSGSDVEFVDGERRAFDAIVFATGYRSTTNKWLKSDDGMIGEDGMARRSYPDHWKGENGLYCAGMVRRGIHGSGEDAELIAEDISKQKQHWSSKPTHNGHMSNGFAYNDNKSTRV